MNGSTSRRSKPPARLLAVLLLALPVFACAAAKEPEKTSLVKAEQGQTAFFNRPVALAAVRQSSVPSPVIVLLETDPWLGVIGSDSPAFALYSDGTAIYRTKSGFKSIKLNRPEKDALIGSIDNASLSGLAGSYEADDATDQPDNNLLVYGDKSPFYISVYGSMKSADVRAKLPKLVLSAYDALRNFDRPDARDWFPDKVEVMVWPYEYAPDASIVWPKNWPGLKDETTRKRGHSYSIFLASTEVNALNKFLSGRKERGAVEIDGKKWAVSIRMPFPHEGLWMAPATE